MSEELKELLFLLHNDRLTEAGKRKLEQEIDKLEEKLKRAKEVINGMIDNEEKYCLEINRLNNIINELEKYLDNLHWFRLGKKEENGNMEYFYASVSNFYEDTKNILKGSDIE